MRTREIKTRNGHKIVIRESLSAEDHVKLKHYVLKQSQLKTQQDGYTKHGKPKFSVTPEMSGAAVAGMETETVKAHIVSFNDDQTDAYNRMMKTLEAAEYDMLFDTINSLGIEEKKKLEISSQVIEASSD